MPELLPLFPAQVLPAPFAHFEPAAALPDFAGRVRHLRRWQQAIQEGYVRAHKEEALQAEFLNLLFEQVLGYEYQATDHRQLQLELKTLTDGTKPDGALGEFVAGPGGGLGGPVRAVVELKDARTGLDAKQRGHGGRGRQETPVEQAFSYPSKFGGSCRWVLVSNFVELRLYSAQDQTRAEVFQLDSLPDSPDQLRRFFALLLPAHLLPAPGTPEAPLDAALLQRQQQELRISKDFYRDYRAARRQLLDHLLEQNPAVPPLDVLQHAQKLLDRVIFVCFCEDKGIIPHKTFRRLLDNVRANVFDPADDKVYRSVRGLFQSIDQGNPAAHINRFNGGLFAPDAALDGLLIRDRTLTPVIELEKYNFASDLNVNILGHIFEQSLSDLEQERARLQGLPYLQKQGKRKQDGIFYTPEYITRYIVRQAVGGWLRERRREAGLDELPELTDDDRASIRLGAGNRLVQPSARVQRHLAAWEQYGQRLENIRVLDPACGSGAFLNEAFGYLLREGEQVNQELAALRAGQFKVFDLDRHILQHNLYGVDLNPESVDITRLSLWLQTANPGRPLTSLDHSIRCGNSLIADPAVAGNRAFDWQAAFPEVFEQGGFDVVIGNPPYLGGRDWKDGTTIYGEYFAANYRTIEYQFDMYIAFWEKAINLANSKGYISFITPNTWLNNQKTALLRKHILENTNIVAITDYSKENVFEEAVVLTIVTTLKKEVEKNYITSLYLPNPDSKDSPLLSHAINQDYWHDGELYIVNIGLREEDKQIRNKIEEGSVFLDSLCEVKFGVKIYETGKGTPKQNAFDAKNRIFESDLQVDISYRRYLRGEDILPYIIKWQDKWLKYGINLAAPRVESLYQGERILVRRIVGEKLICAYTNDNFVTSQLLQIVKPHQPELAKYLLTILNSTLIAYYFRKKYNRQDKTFPEIRIYELASMPIRMAEDKQPFITAADSLLAGHRELHEAEAAAGRLVRAELGLTAPLTGKLALTQPWKTWSPALEKALGRKLRLPEKSTWLDYLTGFQQQQAQRRAALHRQDAALDQLVYQLYQLTPAEIALVEGQAAAG